MFKQSPNDHSDKLSIFVVDDDGGARESIQVMLEPLGFPVVAFASGEEFLDSLTDAGPQEGCAIIDLRLKGMSGISVLESLPKLSPCLIPLLVTAFADVKLAVDVIALGASTVITKPYRDQDLWDAVSAALVLSRRRLVENRRKEQLKSAFDRLTVSEQQVLKCLLRGDSNKQVAAACGVSTRTVDIRRAAILKKMDAPSVLELTWRLARFGPELPMFVDE